MGKLLWREAIINFSIIVHAKLLATQIPMFACLWKRT